MSISEHLLDDNNEVVVNLADGCTIRSGSDTDCFTSGSYVRVCDPDGTEVAYWDHNEWYEDPVLVMGAIINTAAGLRIKETEQ